MEESRRLSRFRMSSLQSGPDEYVDVDLIVGTRINKWLTAFRMPCPEFREVRGVCWSMSM